MSGFTYDEFTTRNLGFVTPEEQALLQQARVFIPGVGGMGGAAFMLLVRRGASSDPPKRDEDQPSGTCGGGAGRRSTGPADASRVIYVV